jgi:UDP-2,4-diacetamido-2,4,6-trideoxy-beta-L-altropyranose hydrolase
MSRNLLICADATPEIGVGHVMRCLALAEAWRGQGGRAWFASASIADGIRSRLQAEAFDVVAAATSNGPSLVIELADRLHTEHIVLDGRQFTADYQCQIRDAGLRLLVLDDYCQVVHYYADCVLNPDLVSEAMYANREPYTRLLLGPQYALLRREFTQRSRRESAVRGEGSRVLITLGGSDPENMTWVGLKAIQQMKRPDLQVRVIVGAANPRLNALRALARDLPGRVEVLSDVKDMPEQMQWPDVAVGASGVTLWELLHMGVAVVCWPRYPADVAVVAKLASRGAVMPLEQNADSRTVAAAITHLLADAALRGSMQAIGRQIVDGLGAQRTADIFSRLHAENGGRLRVH